MLRLLPRILSFQCLPTVFIQLHFLLRLLPTNFVVVVVVVVINSKSDFLFVTWLPTHVSLRYDLGGSLGVKCQESTNRLHRLPANYTLTPTASCTGCGVSLSHRKKEKERKKCEKMEHRYAEHVRFEIHDAPKKNIES